MDKSDSKELTTKPAFLNQSNRISSAFYKTDSVTALRAIKFGMYRLDKHWKEKNIYDSKYASVNLFDIKNWEKSDNCDFSWDDFTCEFSVSEFCENLKITYGGKQRNEIKKAISKAMKEAIMLSDEKKAEWYPWFVKAVYEYSGDKKKDGKEITLVFNPGILAIALGQKEYYSYLELEVLGKLKSVYAIRYYELIQKRYNMKGKKKYNNDAGKWDTEILTIDYIKQYLQIPETAYANRMDNFKSRVIVLPIKEINDSCPNLHVEIEYIKEGRGNKITGFILHCSEKVIVREISKNDSKEQIQEKVDMAKDELEILKMKEKYPDEWNKYYNEEEKNSLPFVKGYFIDVNVFNKMKDDGFSI